MDKNIKLHLIDDDDKLHKLLKIYFRKEDVDLTGSETPEHGLDFVKNNHVDIIILDLMLPGMDGFEVCKKLRKDKPEIPIIMLTAKGDDLSTITGLELGADDYISKPFNPRELMARIGSVLRRAERTDKRTKEHREKSNTIYSKTFDIKLDLDSRTVEVKGEQEEFTFTEFNLLKYLMENIGIVQSRDSLMDNVKGYEYQSFDRSIDTQVSKIRQKLGDNPKKPEIIKTIRSVGYVFSKL